MRNANTLKHRKRQKFTNKLRTTLDYSPPDRFTFYSTENSHQNWHYQYSPQGRIFEELTQIKPFSIINKQQSIDAKINEIVAIHKKSNQRNSFSNEKFEGKKQVQNLKQQCLQIIKNRTPHKRRTNDCYKSPQIIKNIQSSLQNYDDMENEIASQLINESKRQKNVFKATLSRLNNLIEQAEIQFARRKGLDISLDDLRQNGLRKFDKKQRVCTQYSESIDEQIIESFPPKKRKVILDKNDFHTYFKTSNKLIHMTKIEQASDSFYALRADKNLIKNKNDFLYKRYFKKNLQRKTILNSPLDNSD